MRFTPGNEWSWGYADQPNGSTALILNITDQNGARYIFTTHYSTSELREFPQPGQQFCLEDAALLTDFQQGLYEIHIEKDDICLPLALNALACSRFVKLPRPCGRFFLPFSDGTSVHRGQVISLYAKDGSIGDFMVLDDVPDGDVYRVMLLNPEWDLGNIVLKLGAMIRVPLSCICAFRSVSPNRNARYA